jgi:hypothetical protein
MNGAASSPMPVLLRSSTRSGEVDGCDSEGKSGSKSEDLRYDKLDMLSFWNRRRQSVTESHGSTTLRTLHFLPTSAIKFLSERVDEKPSLTFPTRLTVSRFWNPMNIAVSLSSTSFVTVAEVQPAPEPVEPIAPSKTFRSPLRCFTVASRLELDSGVQLMSNFSRFLPTSSSRTRYLCGFFMNVKETLRDLRLRQRSRNDATDVSKSWS